MDLPLIQNAKSDGTSPVHFIGPDASDEGPSQGIALRSVVSSIGSQAISIGGVSLRTLPAEAQSR
jgi:hypothetical protein